MVTTNTRPRFGTLGFYEAMGRALNEDAVWREKGAEITTTMAYDYGPPVSKYFFMRFENGVITEVAQLDQVTQGVAEFVISGSGDTWKAVLQGEISPTVAMATGKFKVLGKKTFILKNMPAFSRILDVMGQLDPIYD